MGLNGIDIASYQKTLVPSQMTTTDFIIIKATQGKSYLNPTFATQYNQAKAAGKLLGIYHYIDGSGADAEANYFVNAVKSVNGIGEAILAVDQQSGQNSAWGNATYVKQLMDKIYSLTGVKPFIYVQHSAAATYNNIQAAGYPLWGAQYANYNQTNYQSSPWRDGKVWGSWGNDPTIRQYSSSGRITGYGSNLDLDLFYGTKEDWKNFAKPANKTTTTTTPTQTSGGTKVTVATTDFTKYANQVSNSGGDERWGIRGGAAGDQTGHEWELKNWYSYPWNCVLRHPKQQVRDLIAELGIQAAKNNNIGYDQYQRNTYWEQLTRVGYRPSRITVPCESDCSAGVIANVKAVGYLLGINELKNITSTYTGNMRSGFKAAGFEVLTDSKYLTSNAYLMPGDILLNDSNHTATNIGIGSKSGYTQNAAANIVKDETPTSSTPKKSVEELAKEVLANKWGTGDARKQALTNAGYDYNAVQAKVNEILKNGGNTTTTTPTPKPATTTVPMFNGKYSQTVAKEGKVTANLLNIRLQPTIHSGNLTSYPTLKRGTVVGVCMQTKDEDGDPWYYIQIKGAKGTKYGFASATYIQLV